MGTVTVAVQDASPTPPRPLPMDAREPDGFGWHLVQELSADVQVYVHSTEKTVWAARAAVKTAHIPRPRR